MMKPEEFEKKIILYIKNELSEQEKREIEGLMLANPEYREIYEKELRLERLLFELPDSVPAPDFQIKIGKPVWQKLVPLVVILAIFAAVIFRISMPGTATGGEFKLVTPAHEVILGTENPEIVVTVPENARNVSFLLDGDVLSGEVKRYDGVYVVKPDFIDEGYHEFKAILKQDGKMKTITKTFYVVNE